jgi:adenine-specific DNA-methyltransferase
MRRLSRAHADFDPGAKGTASQHVTPTTSHEPSGDNAASLNQNSVIFDSLAQAAAFATRQLGMAVEEEDIQGLIQLGLLTNLAIEGDNGPRLRSAEIESYAVLLDWTSDGWAEGNLLAEIDQRQPIPPHFADSKVGTLVLTVGPGFRLSVPVVAFRPYECQLFLREFRRLPRVRDPQPTRLPTALAQVGNVCFRSTSHEVAELAAALWRSIADRADNATDGDRRTTLSIYGVKTRLLPFLTSVIRTVAKDDAAICDLMCGSAIITRKLAATHPVFANDANPYGPTLAVATTANLDAAETASLVERLKSRTAQNVRALENIFAPYLEEEIELLHSARTMQSMAAYRRFCADVPAFFGSIDGELRRLSEPEHCLREMIVQRRAAPRTFPYVLATAYWANVHFGLRQTILLDSLRFAAEAENEPVREIVLAALMQAALLCASGPHFAQPFKPKGLAQYRALVDKRSKRIDAEFFSVLSQYESQRVPTNRILAATKKNWRDALRMFAHVIEGRPGLVYVDPPYTQVQYSRYYHVLNVLVEYDYPKCSGPGRCPERDYRFSSRFEYKPGAAKRELFDLIAECSAAGFDLVMSYSRSGAVTIADIVVMLQARFSTLEVFQANIRHHTQGKAAPRGRLETIEYILAASGPVRPD